LYIIGSITVGINCDKIKKIGIHVYVVTDNTMFFSMIIGRDLLKQFKLCIANEPRSEESEDVNEILSINAIETINNVTDSLIINPEIALNKQVKFRKMFEKEYISLERPKEPKVDAELKLQLKDVNITLSFFFETTCLYGKGTVTEILDELLAN